MLSVWLTPLSLPACRSGAAGVAGRVVKVTLSASDMAEALPATSTASTVKA